MPRSHLLPLLSLLAVACSDVATGPVAPPVPSEARGGNKPGSDAPYQEDFVEWDGSRWTATEHPLGRGWFRPENVWVQDGHLVLRQPAGTFDGGEIRSNGTHRYGVYEASIRASAAPGSLTAFFLYQDSGRRQDEIDVEILPSLGEVWFTVWTDGVQTSHQRVPLGFDPTAGFHVYTIDFTKSRIRFSVDGVVRAEFRSRLPNSNMNLMASAWWPTWLQGGPSAQDQQAIIDWIRY